LGAFIDERVTEGLLEEGDGEENAQGEGNEALGPEEERVRPDEGTVADDRTDEAEERKEGEDCPYSTGDDETSLDSTFENQPMLRSVYEDPPDADCNSTRAQESEERENEDEESDGQAATEVFGHFWGGDRGGMGRCSTVIDELQTLQALQTLQTIRSEERA